MRIHSVVAAAVLAAAAGCAESDGPTPPNATPASVTVTAGDDQIGVAGEPLAESLAVIVRNAAAAPLAGVTVAWDVSSGGGTVSPVASTTDAAGVARTRRTLGPGAGAQTVRATVGALIATFDAVSQIQGAVTIGAKTIGPLADTVLGTLTELEQPINVLVVDHLGIPVSGVTVAWTATNGGTVSPPTSVTNAGGEAMTEYTFGATARGDYGAAATVPGLVGSPVVWDNLSAHPGHPVGLQKTNGDAAAVQAGGQVIHTVTVLDGHGNGAQGVTIQWATATGGGTIVPDQNVSGNGGRAEATRTLGAGLGEQSATATAPDLPGPPVVTFTTLSAETVVRVADNTFLPTTVTTQVGDSVAWQWLGPSSPHNIIFAGVIGAPANEPARTSGAVWRTFGTAGTFSYQCTLHSGMTGSVTVTP